MTDLQERLIKFKDVSSIIATATILREGWETDNELCLCRMKDGSVLAFTTSHNSIRQWNLKDIQEYMQITQKSFTELQIIHTLLKRENR